MISSETAKVWKTSHGRRFLTKRAAFRSEVLHRLMKKDRHEPGGVHDELIGGEHYQDIFYTPEQRQHFENVSARYWRRFRGRAA